MKTTNKRATDAMDLVRKLREVVDVPTEVILRATLWNNQMVRKGHITRTKVVMILVNFEAQIKAFQH